MVVEKRRNKFCTIHCSGKDKGKIIACFDTEKEAEKQHKAIQISRDRLNIKKLFKV